MEKKERTEIAISLDGDGVAHTGAGWLVVPSGYPYALNGWTVATCELVPSRVVGSYLVKRLRILKNRRRPSFGAAIVSGNDACQVLNGHKKEIDTEPDGRA